MPRLSVSDLEPDEIDEAYLLVRHLDVTQRQWQNFCLKLTMNGGGVLAVRAEDHCIHGVAAYLPVASLKYGRALHVEAIASFELGESMHVRKALSAALDQLARQTKCGAVTISLDARRMADPALRRRWESLGLVADTIDFVRPVETAGSSSGTASGH